MRWFLSIFTSMLAWCTSCEKQTEPLQRTWLVEAPAPVFTVHVIGQIGHQNTETVKAPVAELRLAWMASEGSLLEAGDIVARFDTELLELWYQANREELAVLERRTRAARIANERSLYNLRAKLVDAEAKQKTKTLAYQLAAKADPSERGILERELELAQETLAEARQKLEVLKDIQSAGGAAASEVQQALADYERARANVRIPEVNLLEFDDDDGRFDRMKIEQDLTRLGLELASEDQQGSLRGRLAIFAAQQKEDLQWVELEKNRLQEEGSDAAEVITNAIHRSKNGGIINPDTDQRDIPLVPGAELGSRELARVIASSEATIEVLIPEALRETVRIKDRKKGYPTQVRIPAMGAEWLDGRLISVSVIKQDNPAQEPGYTGTVKLKHPPASLTLGAGVECRINLPVPTGAVVIPRWWATADFRPLVIMAHGEKRRLRAQAIGDWLVVTEGLVPGDRIAPPIPETERNLVLYASVKLPEREEITIAGNRPWDLEVEELVDDGTTVTEGQVIARLRRAKGRRTRNEAPEIEKLKAEAARQLARMTANGKLGTAFMDWQQARIDAEAARIAYEIDRQTNDQITAVQGQVSARLSAIQRDLTEDDFRKFSAPAYTDIRSGNQRALDRMNAAVAALHHTQATISAAASYHNRDWPATWTARQSWRRLAAIAESAELTYQRAQATHRKDLAGAEATYSQRMNVAENLGLEAGHREIVAPRTGHLYHNTEAYYPIAVGRRLPSTHLFSMPLGTTRSFEMHLPARRYKEFSIGQEISFYLPAEGARRQVGHITHIADFFEKRNNQKAGRSYRSGRRNPESDPASREVESTVRVTVQFEATAETAAPPGMTVVVELDS